MNKSEIAFDQFLKNFKDSISRAGFKNSIQKDYLLKIFYYSEKHLSAEEIVEIAKRDYNVGIGIATVYRILKFFEQMNIIVSLDVGDGIKRYELNLALHHDHLICVKCHKIVEFFDEELEELQKTIANKNSFMLKSHVVTLYGYCLDCQ